MCAVKRAGFQFNGADESSSGEATATHVATAALRLRSGQALSCPARGNRAARPQTCPLCSFEFFNDTHELFALDSASDIPHSGLTSLSAQQPIR